jgi:hypothetical protein
MMVRSRRKRYVGHVTQVEGMRNAKRVFVEKPEGKRPLALSRRRWERNIKRYLAGKILEGVDWTHLDHGKYCWRALVNTIIAFLFP